MTVNTSDSRKSRMKGSVPAPGASKRAKNTSRSDDPVVREWDMYMNVSPDTHVIVLRYPDKFGKTPHSAMTDNKPIEIRIKPSHGLIEVDVPVDPHADTVEKAKAIKYGEAMRKSRVLKERGGSFGIAGGFGLGGSTAKVRAGHIGQRGVDGPEPNLSELLGNWDEAVDNGHVLTKITFGGHIDVRDETSPNLYVGHFENGKVYFTKVDALCVLRPQLAHIDALNEQTRFTQRMQSGADTEETEAVHVNMTIKKAENETLDSIGEQSDVPKVLKAMREEPWQRLAWIDFEESESLDKFDNTFSPSKGSKTSQLTCNMTKEQWLDVISCPRVDPMKPDVRAIRVGPEQQDLSSTDTSDDEQLDEQGSLSDGRKSVSEEGEDM